MDDIPTENLGYIQERRPRDFLQGTLPYEIVVQSGDWRSFLPPGEPQYSQVADSKGCVSFSNNNVAEILLELQGFKFNFSDRALAKLSGTTDKGNSFGKVEDAARHFGRILESDWPTPENFTWEEFYKDIPAEILAKAIFFEESYEYINTDPETLKYYLKQSPIQIAIPTPVPNHAVCLVHVEGQTAWYFDSYPGSTNYLKTIDVAKISDAMRLIIKRKTMIVYKLQGEATLYMAVGNILVGYASDFPTFQSEFPGAVIVELPPAEFVKFKISKLVIK